MYNSGLNRMPCEPFWQSFLTTTKNRAAPIHICIFITLDLLLLNPNEFIVGYILTVHILYMQATTYHYTILNTATINQPVFSNG